MAEDTRYHVFLSHNSADKPVVEELARRLDLEGIQAWLDTWSLIPGDAWQEATEKALRECDTCAVFIGPSGLGEWHNEEMRTAIHRRVGEKGFRVIPVLLPSAKWSEESRLPDFLERTTRVEFRTVDDADAFHRLVCGIRGVSPGPVSVGTIRMDSIPYRGLRVFEADHSDFFFGRETLVKQLLDTLHQSIRSEGQARFITIIGPSGSGKSSLARAGLVGALRSGWLPGSNQWPIIICRPGRNPLQSLIAKLADTVGRPVDADYLLSEEMEFLGDQSALHTKACQVLENFPPHSRLLILIDQFEEVFTLLSDPQRVDAFINNLLYASGLDHGRTVVVLTLRADFVGKCTAYPDLAAALCTRQRLVPRMREDELRRAIEQPARLVGCELEAGLTDSLVSEVGKNAGSLPLLQHVLFELWQRRQGNLLTLSAYEDIGGIQGALQQHAEGVYAVMGENEREVCRRIFLRLIQPGENTEDTKRRVRMGEFEPAASTDQHTVESVIMRLAGEKARLVTIEGEGVQGEFVEVAHEALIRGWSRLRDWIEEDRESLRRHRRLREAAEEWEQNGRHEGYLVQDARLEVMRQWAETHASNLNRVEKEFLEASQEQAIRETDQLEAQRQRLRLISERLAEFEGRYEKTTNLLNVIKGLPKGLPDERSANTSQMLDFVLQNAMELSQTTSGLIHLLDQDGESVILTVEAPVGFGHPPPRLQFESGLTRTVVRTLQALNIPDLRNDHRVNPELLKKGIRALLGLPLLSAGRTLLGVLFLHDTRRREFTDQELELLATLSEQAAKMLENARLYEALWRRSNELELLLKYGLTMISLRDDEVFWLLAHVLPMLMNLDDTLLIIALYDRKDNCLSFPLAIERDNGEIIDDIRWGRRETEYIYPDESERVQQFMPRVISDYHSGFTEFVLVTGQLRIINGHMPEFTESNGIQVGSTFGRLQRPVYSWLGVPMCLQDRVVGVISIQSFRREYAFDAEHRGMLKAVADYAAAAIENTRLYSAMQRSSEEIQQKQDRLIAQKQLAALEAAAASLQHSVEKTVHDLLDIARRLQQRIEPEDTASQAVLDAIHRDSARTSRLLARIQAPIAALGRNGIDVNSVLRDALDRLLQQRNQESGSSRVEVRLDLASFLPSTHLPLAQLTEVIRNAVDNAFLAMKEGGRLSVCTRLAGTAVEVLIGDTGPGIPTCLLPDLFQKPIDPEHSWGAGLSLWLNRMWLQSWGGDIILQKSDPTGTEILVQVPILSPESDWQGAGEAR
jgi:GAF domain-containing protein